jgi:heptaprenyl diphosphate synthase
VLRTMALGSPEGDELAALLGAPLDAAEQRRALAIVRSNLGVASAVETAGEYVDRAISACDRFPDTEATAALRSAPAALLANVSIPA